MSSNEIKSPTVLHLSNASDELTKAATLLKVELKAGVEMSPYVNRFINPLRRLLTIMEVLVSAKNALVENKPLPKWTVLYNIVTPGSEWIGTGWEFFNDEVSAQKRFDHHVAIGNCPTKRPYAHGCDWDHLGAAHRM